MINSEKAVLLNTEPINRARACQLLGVAKHGAH
jgi:hypothetical protein